MLFSILQYTFQNAIYIPVLVTDIRYNFSMSKMYSGHAAVRDLVSASNLLWIYIIIYIIYI